jgi:hypothetical protein
MSRVTVTIAGCGDRRGQLSASAIFPDTATVYRAEFPDSLPGAVGLARFVAMFGMLSGAAVRIDVQTEIEHQAVRNVVAWKELPVRYDRLYRPVDCRKEAET